MIALWMLYAAAVAGAVGLAAAALERVLLSRGRAIRFVWAAALLGSLVLPATMAAFSSPDSPSTGLVATGVAEAHSAPRGPAEAGEAEPGFITTALGDRLEALRPVAARLPALDRPLGVAWAVASGGMLLLLLLSLRAVGRRRARWPRATVEGRRVLLAPDFGPAVVGVRRPEIVVPAWALRLERGLLRLVLLHEDAHRSAGDTALLTAGVCAVALAPWNPFLWWQLRRLRLAVEMDCDARVLARGVSRVTYGRLLLEVGRRRPRSGFVVAALGEHTSLLERRIRMITARASNRSILRTAASLAVAMLLVVAACETPVPTELEEVLREVEAAPRGTITLDGPDAFPPTDDVLVLVDGVPTPLASLRDLDTDEIKTIEVVKGEAAAGLVWEHVRDRMEQIEGLNPDARHVVVVTTESVTTEKTWRSTLRPREGTGPEAPDEPREVEGVLREATVPPAPEEALTVAPEGDPVIVVDGVRSDLTLAELGSLSIERVEVVTGEAAVARLGTEAAHGIVYVITGDGRGGPR